ncbi:MAG: NAD-dependent epimerase/dehydratase family protein [Blautia marasmi]
MIVDGKTTIYIGARSEQKFQKRFSGYEAVKFVQYDALVDFDSSIRPDYIICGAGLASPELYTTMPVETVLSNFDGVHTLLEFAKHNSTSRLLYISSSEVYGKKVSIDPFIEGEYGVIDIDNIRSSYAIAKEHPKCYVRHTHLNMVLIQ